MIDKLDTTIATRIVEVQKLKQQLREDMQDYVFLKKNYHEGYSIIDALDVWRDKAGARYENILLDELKNNIDELNKKIRELHQLYIEEKRII